MEHLFIDANGRLRSGWRAAIFLIAYSACWFMLGSIAFSTIGSGASGTAVFVAVNALISIALALGFGWLFGRIFEDLPFRALGSSLTRGWLNHLVVGSMIGAVTVGIAVLPAAVAGGLRFELNAADVSLVSWSLVSSLVIFAIAAAFEEAFFRGYLLQTLTRSDLAWLAIVLTSVAFGSVHLDNPNVNYIAALNTVLAGVWFSLAYLRTRDLWFPLGMHLMWNFVQGSIFGIEVSGITSISTAPLFRESDIGPQWLTGTEYGIEGSVPCTFALLIAIVLTRYLPGIRADEELVLLSSPLAENPNSTVETTQPVS